MTSTDGLCRDHHVSLRRQLAVGFEAAIRDGHLRPDAELPSSRDLAGQTGLHRSTVRAAYARLRVRGWIEGGTGGRLRVRAELATESRTPAGTGRGRPTGDESLAAIRRGVSRLLADARRSGVGRIAAIEALAMVASRASAPCGLGQGTASLSLFEPRRGFGTALAAELALRLGAAVSVTRRFPAASAACGAPIMVRDEILDRVSAAWPGSLDLIPVSVAGGTHERGLVRRIVRGGLVTLVSVSRTIRRYAAELAAREFDRGVSFRALGPDDPAALLRAVSASRLLLFDEPSRALLPDDPVPRIPIRLLREAEIATLRTYLKGPVSAVSMEQRRHALDSGLELERG